MYGFSVNSVRTNKWNNLFSIEDLRMPMHWVLLAEMVLQKFDLTEALLEQVVYRSNGRCFTSRLRIQNKLSHLSVPPPDLGGVRLQKI